MRTPELFNKLNSITYRFNQLCTGYHDQQYTPKYKTERINFQTTINDNITNTHDVIEIDTFTENMYQDFSREILHIFLS